MLTSVLGNKVFLTGEILILSVVFSSVLCSWNLKNRALELRWEKEQESFSKNLEKDNQNLIYEFTGSLNEFYSGD